MDLKNEMIAVRESRISLAGHFYIRGLCMKYETSIWNVNYCYEIIEQAIVVKIGGSDINYSIPLKELVKFKLRRDVHRGFWIGLVLTVLPIFTFGVIMASDGVMPEFTMNSSFHYIAPLFGVFFLKKYAKFPNMMLITAQSGDQLAIYEGVELEGTYESFCDTVKSSIEGQNG